MVTVYAGGPSDELDRFYASSTSRRALETEYFGDDPPRNDYEFTQRVLAVTPETLERKKAAAEAQGYTKLFEEKIKIIRDVGDDGIFSISTPLFRGFQFNTPASKISSVEVRLYNDHTKLYFSFLTQGDARKATQADINRIVQSIRIDPDAHAPGSDKLPLPNK